MPGLGPEALEFLEGLSFWLPKRRHGQPRFGRLDYGLEEYSDEYWLAKGGAVSVLASPPSACPSHTLLNLDNGNRILAYFPFLISVLCFIMFMLASAIVNYAIYLYILSNSDFHSLSSLLFLLCFHLVSND